MKKTIRIMLVMVIVLVVCVRTDAGILDKLKSVGEKVGESVSKAKESWKAREKKCSECGRIIHVGTTCVSCKAKAARKRSREVVDSGKKAWQKTKPELVAAQKRIVNKYVSARSAVKKAYPLVRKRYGVALDKIRDPEVRKKATEALGAVMVFRRQIKETKNKIVYTGLSSLSAIPVSTRDGNMTLGELAVSRLSERYPGLRDTGMYDDPVATVAAVICTDTKYFLNDVKLLKKDGRNVSVFGAIGSSSAFSSDSIKYLKIVEAMSDVTHSLSTGEDGLEALSSVASAIESAND